MSRFVTFAGLLAIIVATTATAHSVEHSHHCIHDTPEMQENLYGPIINQATGLRKLLHPNHVPHSPQRYRFAAQSEPVLDSEVSATERRSFHPSSAESMRVVISTADLEDATKYCEDATETNPDFKGSTIQCTADHIFTADKKDIYLNKVIPAVKEIFATFLNVNRVSGNLVVGSTCGNDFTTPSDHTSTGVADADFVLYAAAGPTSGSTVAFAGYCSLDSNNRPVTGRMNLNPKYIVWDDNSPASQRQLVRTVVHEILHALGFSGSYIGNYYAADTIKTETRRGQTVSYISSAKAVEKAKEQFDCTTLTGPEMEDEGGTGTLGSHWERRTHFDDVMAGYVGEQMFFTATTLGLLEDSGHYFPDYSKAETPFWMDRAGCGVHDDRCDTVSGGQGVYFCITPNEALCTADFTASGYCAVGNYTSDLPSYNQYYSGIPTQGGTTTSINYCPIAAGYSNRQCNDPFNSSPNSTSNYYANDGRCFMNSGAPSCLRTRCINGTVVEFQHRNSDTTWYTCPSTGAIVSGVECPDATRFCTSDLLSGIQATTPSTTMGDTTSTTSTASTTTVIIPTTEAPSTTIANGTSLEDGTPAAASSMLMGIITALLAIVTISLMQ